MPPQTNAYENANRACDGGLDELIATNSLRFVVQYLAERGISVSVQTVANWRKDLEAEVAS